MNQGDNGRVAIYELVAPSHALREVLRRGGAKVLNHGATELHGGFTEESASLRVNLGGPRGSVVDSPRAAGAGPS